MKKPNRSLPWEKIKTYSLKTRKNKVHFKDAATPYTPGSPFHSFLKSLPNFLSVQDFRSVVDSLVKAHRGQRLVLFGIGSHVIKVGLSPLLIDLMERGIINGIAMNGSGIIHDFEMAYLGQTSEDVDKEINQGTFGMAEETGRILNQTIEEGMKKGVGLGEAVGQRILNEKFTHYRKSILANGVRLGIPVTIHVAMGTDIIHMHPTVNGAAIGQTSLQDFRIFTSLVSQLEGGVYLNIGSAVLLPEVFLKSITIARNLGYPLKRFTTVNMDFFQHYRPLTNVVKRPTQKGGKGYSLTGHHEIMVPLLAAALLETLHPTKKRRPQSPSKHSPTP
ncbi:MAG TPA: hypothetical protein VGB26_08180 [Nitrospiria bacterium]|jgi:hypothetical protein